MRLCVWWNHTILVLNKFLLWKRSWKNSQICSRSVKLKMMTSNVNLNKISNKHTSFVGELYRTGSSAANIILDTKMQTSNELLNQRWFETKWHRRLNRFSYVNINNDLDFGIGFIFWLGPVSDTLDGFIDFVLLPEAELSVLASSAISTAVWKFKFNLLF